MRYVWFKTSISNYPGYLQSITVDRYPVLSNTSYQVGTQYYLSTQSDFLSFAAITFNCNSDRCSSTHAWGVIVIAPLRLLLYNVHVHRSVLWCTRYTTCQAIVFCVHRKLICTCKIKEKIILLIDMFLHCITAHAAVRNTSKTVKKQLNGQTMFKTKTPNRTRGDK